MLDTELDASGRAPHRAISPPRKAGSFCLTGLSCTLLLFSPPVLLPRFLPPASQGLAKSFLASLPIELNKSEPDVNALLVGFPELFRGRRIPFLSFRAALMVRAGAIRRAGADRK